jgi:hypothetical protein
MNEADGRPLDPGNLRSNPFDVPTGYPAAGTDGEAAARETARILPGEKR